MISLASEMTDSKGRHARGWLFFDAECRFCSGIATWLMGPMKRRGLAVAPVQDPRVGSLLGLSQGERRRAICFVRSNDRRYMGASAVLAVARELWWAWPLMGMARFPGMMSVIDSGYRWIARHRRCRAEHCTTGQVASRS